MGANLGEAGWDHLEGIGMDHIEIRGLRVVGIIGVLHEERVRAQPFEVDLDLEVDTREAGATDDVRTTVSYVDPIEIVERIIRDEHHELLEKVAARITEELLIDTRISAVEVTVRKLRPPIPSDMHSTGVRIRRSRSQLAVERRPRVRAYVALGTNLGDRRANLRAAIEGFDGVAALSGVYETEPVGGPGGQGRYLNMVIALDTDLDPFALLARCRALETKAGRVRTVRDAPRELDADVLLYADVTIQSVELTIPHPRMWERRFVMAPLADVAPDKVRADWETTLPVDGVQRVDGFEISGLDLLGNRK